MIGLYYNSAKNISVNNVHELPFYEEKIAVADSSFERSDEFWDTARHERISANDKKVYLMVDSLNNQPLIKSYIDIVEIAVEGHIPKNKVDLGPKMGCEHGSRYIPQSPPNTIHQAEAHIHQWVFQNAQFCCAP